MSSKRSSSSSALANMPSPGSILQINASPEQSLRAYLASIRKIEILTQEKEQELGHKWYDEGDVVAARSLVMSHLRFVVYIARTYTGYGLPLSDLIQEGNVGLMRAVKRFDPNREIRLITFAVYWIRAEIHEYVLKNWSIVKIATTKAQRKLFFNLRSSKKRLAWMTPKEVQSIAKDLGVPEKTVREMEARMSFGDSSLDSPIASDGEEQMTALDYLSDNTINPEDTAIRDDMKEQTHLALTKSLEGLDERSRFIIQNRWLSPEKISLQEIANDYGISAERVRQIEKNAFKKVRAQLVHLQEDS